MGYRSTCDVLQTSQQTYAMSGSREAQGTALLLCHLLGSRQITARFRNSGQSTAGRRFVQTTAGPVFTMGTSLCDVIIIPVRRHSICVFNWGHLSMTSSFSLCAHCCWTRLRLEISLCDVIIPTCVTSFYLYLHLVTSQCDVIVLPM